MKKGLILEGGGLRGLFSCGVIDVFLENNIYFDGAAGISAGAAFGCNIKSAQIGRALRYNKQYANDSRYMSWRNFFKTGNLFDVDFCYKTLPNELDIFDTDTFSKNPLEFYVGATSLQTGRAVFHRCADGGENDINWICASSSMPVVSKPVELDGKLYLDGGVADSIPIKFMESIGYDRNVIILTQPEDYIKKPNPLMPVIKRMYRAYPKFVQSAQTRHIRYNRCTEYIWKKQRDGEVFVICPEAPLGIGRTEKDPDKMDEAYNEGRRIALSSLDSLRSFLGQED